MLKRNKMSEVQINLLVIGTCRLNVVNGSRLYINTNVARDVTLVENS